MFVDAAFSSGCVQGCACDSGVASRAFLCDIVSPESEFNVYSMSGFLAFAFMKGTIVKAQRAAHHVLDDVSGAERWGHSCFSPSAANLR